MRWWKSALSLALLPVLGGCLGSTPERARIVETRVVRDGGRAELELTQELRLSRTMRDALDAGIPLRLVYELHGCGGVGPIVLELRYAPLTRHYELQRLGGPPRSFARRSALLASLDRVRLPLADEPPPACQGTVSVALDLTTLPTPLRFPALLERAEWRLVSPAATWPSPRA